MQSYKNILLKYSYYVSKCLIYALWNLNYTYTLKKLLDMNDTCLTFLNYLRHGK